MKRFWAVVTLVVLVTACTKSNSSTTASQSSTSVAPSDAATSAATDAASDAPTGAASDAATSAAAGNSGEATMSTASPVAAASGAAFVPIDVPIYPGANKDPNRSIAMSGSGGTANIDYYGTKDDSGTVAAWYKAHLPSSWQSFQLASGKKTTATFASAEHGNDGQGVVVTGQDDGTTTIQISTTTKGK